MCKRRAYNPEETAKTFIRLVGECGFSTNKSIAEHFDVSMTTVSNWKKGIKAPSSDKLIEFAGEFGYSLDEVFEWNEYEKD